MDIENSILSFMIRPFLGKQTIIEMKKTLIGLLKTILIPKRRYEND